MQIFRGAVFAILLELLAAAALASLWMCALGR